MEQLQEPEQTATSGTEIAYLYAKSALCYLCHQCDFFFFPLFQPCNFRAHASQKLWVNVFTAPNQRKKCPFQLHFEKSWADMNGQTNKFRSCHRLLSNSFELITETEGTKFCDYPLSNWVFLVADKRCNHMFGLKVFL